MAIRVLLPQPILPAGYEFLREHGYEAVDGRGFTEDDIVADIADCDAIIVRTAKITRRIFDAAPKLKILARHGAGYDGVDLQAAREHGVLVCTAGGANAISVAELTIFYMLYCSRNFKKVEKLYLEDYRQAKMAGCRIMWISGNAALVREGSSREMLVAVSPLALHEYRTSLVEGISLHCAIDALYIRYTNRLRAARPVAPAALPVDDAEDGELE